VDRWKVSGVYNLGEWQNEGLAPLAPTVIFDSHIALIQRYLADGKPLGLLVDEGFFAGQKDGESRIPQLRHYRDPGADGAADKGSEPSCGVCRVRPYLLPDGRLIPCIGMTGSSLERTMPRLTETPLAEIYSQNDGAFLSTVSITVDTVVARNSECQACEHRFECGGGCRADAVVGGNDLFGRSSFLCYAFKSGYRARLKEIADV
jgi:radical SAM protein with 4Fe4S-binding SPASM domain